MAKTKLTKRKKPKQRAAELASTYILKYSPDGSTFQLYKKGEEDAGPVSEEGLWEEGQGRLFRGRRYRTNKLLERNASRHIADEKESKTNDGTTTQNNDLEEIKSTYEELFKKQNAEWNKKYNDLLKLINTQPKLVKKPDKKSNKIYNDESEADIQLIDGWLVDKNEDLSSEEIPQEEHWGPFEQFNYIRDLANYSKSINPIVTAPNTQDLYNYMYDNSTISMLDKEMPFNISTLLTEKAKGKKYVYRFGKIYDIDKTIDIIKQKGLQNAADLDSRYLKNGMNVIMRTLAPVDITTFVDTYGIDQVEKALPKETMDDIIKIGDKLYKLVNGKLIEINPFMLSNYLITNKKFGVFDNIQSQNKNKIMTNLFKLLKARGQSNTDMLINPYY